MRSLENRLDVVFGALFARSQLMLLCAVLHRQDWCLAAGSCRESAFTVAAVCERPGELDSLSGMVLIFNTS